MVVDAQLQRAPVMIEQRNLPVRLYGAKNLNKDVMKKEKTEETYKKHRKQQAPTSGRVDNRSPDNALSHR